MVSRVFKKTSDTQDLPYTQYRPLNDQDEQASSDLKGKGVSLGLRGVAQDEEETAGLSHEQLEGGEEGLMSLVGGRGRSHSVLRNRLKQMKAGLSNEKQGIADAFIKSTDNKPQYMKEEHSSDLLV